MIPKVNRLGLCFYSNRIPLNRRQFKVSHDTRRSVTFEEQKQFIAHENETTAVTSHVPILTNLTRHQLSVLRDQGSNCINTTEVQNKQWWQNRTKALIYPYVPRYNEIVYNIFKLWTSQLEIRDREKRGIERKGNFIIDLRCYKLFHCTVGLMIYPKILYDRLCFFF